MWQKNVTFIPMLVCQNSRMKVWQMADIMIGEGRSIDCCVQGERWHGTKLYHTTISYISQPNQSIISSSLSVVKRIHTAHQPLLAKHHKSIAYFYTNSQMVVKIVAIN